MAFDVSKFLERYKPTTPSVEKYKPTTPSVGGFDVTKFLAKKYPTTTTTKKLDTSAGLYNLAVQSGLQKQADKVLEDQTGEETKKIFSGGFISDIFDTLNALQYGVTGVLKGKGFMEGVKTRQSFSDKDALGDKGIPGMIGGIALDIAVDPLTYVAPWTIAKKIPLLSKVAKALKGAVFGKKAQRTIKTAEGLKTFMEVKGGTKAGKYLADKFVWMFGKDPVYKAAYEKSIRNIAVGTQNIAKIARGVGNLTPEVAAKILTRDETGRFARVGIKELQKVLKPKDLELVKTAWTKIDDLGQEAVDLGLLSKTKYEENIGEYIKNAYTDYELAKKKGLFGTARVGIKGIKARKAGLTVDKMKELGQIDNPAYLLFRSVFDLTKDIENAKLFRATAQHLGSNVMQVGFKQLPKTQRVGALKGKWVPENIYDAIQDIIEPVGNRTLDKIMGNFKFFKVIMNPATHARNVVSNQILNWWKLGMNPLDPRTIKANALALAEIAKKSGKWMDEAKTAGYNVDTFAANELRSILDSPEALGVGKKFGTAWQKTKTKLGDIYQGEENFAKLSAFIFNRKHRGLGIEDAWKAAESATFNYAQVTPFIRKMRTAIWGFPFITFTVKSTPIAIETALKAPQRISAFGKIKQAIESQSDIKTTDRERAAEPQWIKDGFYVKLPMKDKHGRSAYFDLTYIIPFGDLMAGNFMERQISRETGLKEGVAVSALSKSPLFGFIKEISRNQDFYGDKIWKEGDSSDKQLADLMRHTAKTYLPPLVSDQIPGGYQYDGTHRLKGIRGAIQPKENIAQQRTLMQEMLRNVGAKIQPVDVDIQEKYQEWGKKKALKTFLEEQGVLNKYEISYIPKDKKNE